MPKVDGKEFPYTPGGKKAAKKASKKKMAMRNPKMMMKMLKEGK